MHFERVLILMAFTVAALAGLYHLKPTHTRQPASVITTSTYKFSTSVEDAAVQLKQNTKADIFKGLDANAQSLLIKLVREHCSKKYEDQTCLHYAITCGRPCLAFLNKTERRRMLASYQKIQGGS